MKILIAEDDALSRMMLEKSLQRAGYEVTSVKNGAQALEELARKIRRASPSWIGSCRRRTGLPSAAKSACAGIVPTPT